MTRSSAVRPDTTSSRRFDAASPASSGTGCAGFDDLDPAARPRVAVARDDETGELAIRPVRLQRLGHRRGCLAGADDDDAPGARRRQLVLRRQVRRQAERRLRARDRRVEEAAQQDARLDLRGHRQLGEVTGTGGSLDGGGVTVAAADAATGAAEDDDCRSLQSVPPVAQSCRATSVKTMSTDSGEPPRTRTVASVRAAA
jgi:hypothetical protein